MGAVTFSLDSQLVKHLKEKLNLSTFIETGTFHGNTIDGVLAYFDELITIELSEVLFQSVKERFAKENKVQPLLGNSAEILSKIVPEQQTKSVLYWLDAHWCIADNTAGETSQCPLVDEIRAIKDLNDQSVILIDDARLFLSPPPKPHEISQWPTFDEIIKALQALNSQHQIMVVNDVIAFYPAHAHSAIASYAQTFGIDWLQATQALVERPSLLAEIYNKNQIIQQKDYFKLYSMLCNTKTFNFCINMMKRIRAIFYPRIGNLNQYLPRELTALPVYQSKNRDDLLKFSIVTPSFNQGQYIESTIQSVLNQNYKNLEYFIQDGGSKDNTLIILERYNDQLSGWTSERDAGQANAINRGFERTDGDIMAWLNSDDLILPHALKRVSDYFLEHPEIDVVYGNRLLINENGMEIGRWILPGHNKKTLSWVDYIPQETLFWRRRAWEKIKKLDESFQYAMDWDLLTRFREANLKFAHIPHFLGAFRVHSAQKTTSTSDVGYEEMDRIRKKVLGYVPSRKEIHRAILPYLFCHIAVDLFYRVRKRIRKTMDTQETIA